MKEVVLFIPRPIQMPLTLCVTADFSAQSFLHYSDDPTLLTIKADMSNKLPQSSNFHSLKAAFILSLKKKIFSVWKEEKTLRHPSKHTEIIASII